MFRLGFLAVARVVNAQFCQRQEVLFQVLDTVERIADVLVELLDVATRYASTDSTRMIWIAGYGTGKRA